MKKILFGALIAALAIYYLDPEQGERRRNQLAQLWATRKDTVLDAARATSSTVAGVSHDVSDLVGAKGAERHAGHGNGQELTAPAALRPGHSPPRAARVPPYR